MEGQPHRRAGTSGTTGGSDPVRIEVPLLCTVAQNLQGTGAIQVRGRSWRRGRKPIVKRRNTPAGDEVFPQYAGGHAAFIPSEKPATVDHEYQRSRLAGLR